MNRDAFSLVFTEQSKKEESTTRLFLFPQMNHVYFQFAIELLQFKDGHTTSAFPLSSQTVMLNSRGRTNKLFYPFT